MNREANISEKLIDEKSIVLKYMGIQISRMRKKKKLTIEDIADKTLLSESYIRAIEKGTYACSIINFLKICLALKVNPDIFFEEYTIQRSEKIYKYLQGEDKDIGRNIIQFLKTQ